jgi:hypothetical protein
MLKRRQLRIVGIMVAVNGLLIFLPIPFGNSIPAVITHRHFRRADRDEAPDFRAPLPGSPISESMCAWIALICSA